MSEPNILTFHMTEPNTIEWRPIEGFEGRYEISNYGHVKILAGLGSGRPNSDRIAKLGSSPQGYLQKVLYREDGSYITKRVHLLVLGAFVAPRPLGAWGLHTDDDRLNNHVSNLRWGTRGENARDQLLNKRHYQANQTECKWGHPLSGGNLGGRSGKRVCRECARRRKAEFKVRRDVGLVTV